MNPDSPATLLVEVARVIVSDVAPDESPLFDVSTQEYLANPRRADAADGDHMLGFGGGAEFELLTPVILSMTSGIIAFLVDSTLNATKAETKSIIEARVRLLFKRFRSDSSARIPAPPPLTRDQLAEIRQVALDIATRMSVPAPEATLLADAAVGQLAVAP